MGAGQVTVPPPPPGFAILEDEDKPKKKRKESGGKNVPPPPEGFVLVDPEAVDGDTIRDGDTRVRLLGIDAPERDQMGFDRQGNAVPVGAQSQSFMGDALEVGPVTLGKPEGYSSYGRTVAPITAGGTDIGLGSLRMGQSFAAPDYLGGDPERLSQYVQAESLARTNKLGVHGVYTQTPAEFRDAPVTQPDSEQVAQFWDTPTPLQPLPPELRDGYAKLLKEGTADEINAFLSARGYETARPDDLKAWVARRDAGEAVDYAISQEAPPSMMIDSGDGASGAFARKFGSGFLMGGLDELGAVVDTLGATPGRESIWNSDSRLADIWANNQRQNAGILSYDQTYHPLASTTGEVAGALTSGFAIPYGQGARTVPQLARVGAVFGGAEGFLGTDGGIGERLKGAAIGVPVGGALNAVGGKALEYGLPYAAKGVRAVFNRDGAKVAEATGETVDAYGEQQALDSALSAANDDIPPPPEGFRITTQAMEGLPDEKLTSEAIAPPVGQTRRLLDPATDAERMAAAEQVAPRDVLPLAGNVVDGVEDAAAAEAGRYAPVSVPDERAALDRGTIKSYSGKEVPKVGPLDMVGWLRSRGGLRDEGGDLRFMGITSNAPRKGLDHVGQEARFGPILNPDGLSLDDAALQAWEAGYFPELTDRPDINTFLEALGDTYNGAANRRFRPEDGPSLHAYENLQAERYDLEQRQHLGEQVFEDRSSPASDGAPFPPVQAYEEWPSDAIARVDNIDVTKLDTPQDIRRALKTTHNALGGFDAAKRGRITQAETERLAADLNMTPEQLLSRRKGKAFNAEEALAARQILAKSGNELVNLAKRVQNVEDPGDELLAQFRQALARHGAIQEQVAGMTAEAGRALQQFRQAADARSVKGDVLHALVRAGGGRDGLKDAAVILIDAVEMGPGKFNALVEKLRKPTFRDKVGELYINFLLSWPQTHAVNITSNTLTTIAQIPEFAAGAIVGGARRAFNKNAVDRITANEVGARAFGLLQGAKEGARLFARSIKTGEPSDFASKVEGEQFKAIGGLKGEVVRVPTRLLSAEDEFFKGIARRMELNARAVRIAHKEGLKGEDAKARIGELVANPTDEMFEAALDYGRYLTFQTKLGPAAQDISNFANRHLPLKFFLPFVRTPTNLLKFAAERSPLAPALKEWRSDFIAGGARRDMAIARMAVGSGFGYAFYEAARNGVLTGSAPSDEAKARLLYADGWKPYSVKLGDTYYSYKRLDPFATTLGTAADLALLPEGMTEKQREDQTTIFVASIMGNLASKTWLTGVSDIVSAMHEPDRYADNLVERLVGSLLVPNLVAGTARTIDPVSRQTDGISEALQARIPGQRDDLLPRRDVWGEVVKMDESWGPDFLSPIWVGERLSDPVNNALLQTDYAPGYPSKKIGSRELTPQEYDRYSERAGKLSHERLTTLITGGGWDSLDDEAKVKAAKKAVDGARKDARAEMFGGDPGGGAPASPKGGKGGTVPPPPSGFAVSGESGGANVYQDLQDAIPGIGITSGFRTREYQADMRRRGYHPAEDSRHLDGSALDLTPPAGKSMGWLRAQVMRRFPKAKLLPEGDHLHAVFPGYYGAPVVGGAKAAGLRNPLEGMPPPPAGFVVQ